MLWDHGQNFLNGHPFVFKKWSWDFVLSKENVFEILLWIKLLNFPLCLWNATGFSKVANKVGVPLAIDNLTTTKAHITFAWICVQINPSSLLLDSIPINLNGKKIQQPLLYDWKLIACHNNSTCLLNSFMLVVSRGLSYSHQTRRPLPPRPPARPTPYPPPKTKDVIPTQIIQNSEAVSSSPLDDLNQAPILSPP